MTFEADQFRVLQTGLRRIETAVYHLHKEIKHMTETQANFDNDLSGLASLVGQLLAAYQTASSKANAAGVDLTNEDAQVQQLASSITAALPSPTPGATSTAAPNAGATTPGASTAPVATGTTTATPTDPSAAAAATDTGTSTPTP